MRFATALTVLMSLSAGAAMAAPNLVLNGNFELNTFTNIGSGRGTEFGASYAPGGQNLTNWLSPSTNAYNIYLRPATASNTTFDNRFSGGGGTAERLAISFGTTASPTGGNFVALDGDTNVNGPLIQQINGLTIGRAYTLAFFYAASQIQSRTGATTEKLQVTLGTETHTTPTLSIPTQGFSSWVAQALTFTATGTSELLSFLSIGTPNGLPPIALLDGVSLTEVPEPASFALLGAGLLGAGMVRRRKA